MKNIFIFLFAIGASLFTACNSNANGSVDSKSDTSADTVGKHSVYGIDTLSRKRMDSVTHKNDSLH